MTATLQSTARTVVTSWLSDFENALTAGDIDAASGLFDDDSYWRDLIAFTWNITTVEGPAGVRDLLSSTLSRVQPSGFAVADDLGEPTQDGGVADSWIQFETAIGRGVGHLRLKDGKAWTLLTTMFELKGHEEPKGERRPKGAEHGANPDRQTWLERQQAEAEQLGHTVQPYTVIIGGGQGGIALGARLRQLGVPTIIIDRNPRPGDAWRNRYKSLCLHDPVWYDHLPYIDFPKNWPVFAPKDKIGDWLEMYAKVMELNYWGSTECKNATYDEDTGEWTVVVERDGAGDHPAAEAAGAGHRHVRQGQCAELRGHGRLPGRSAPLVQAPGTGRLPRQAGRRHRRQQLGTRHLRRALGGRRRRHHGAALVDAHRQVGFVDERLRSAGCTRRRPGRRNDDTEGRPDLCVAAVPDHARIPDPGVRRDSQERRGLLLPARCGRIHARLRR